MPEDKTIDPSRFMTPEAKRFMEGVATRGEMYAFLVQMTSVQSHMADAMTLMLEGKNHQAITVLLTATERLGSLQKSFEIIPGWRNARPD